MKFALILGAIVVLGIGAVEIALRWLFGFGKPPLYVADSQIGYRLAPNQRTKRFGNVIAINQYSMRGPAIAPQPDPQTLRVLLLGDSIANGGWWTDQSDILSVQMQRQLAAASLKPYTTAEVLNASANSWGPRNELAYLAKFGTFNSHVVVLLLNTDDLFATAPTSAQVGRDHNYPNRYPPLALIEVLTRFQKSKPFPALEAARQEGGDRVGANLDAIGQLHRITQLSGCRLMVAMTPLLREVMPPGPRDYEVKARDRILQFMAAEQIIYVDFLAPFTDCPDAKTLYRDHIHLSPQGNARVSQTLSDTIQSLLRTTQGTRPLLPDTLLEDPW